MYGITGIIIKHLAGKLRALPAKDISPALAAHGDGAFAVKRMPVGLYAAFAVVRLFIIAVAAIKPAS